MNIPGQQVSHQIITHECRTNRGNNGALLEAWDRISEAYWNLIGRGLDPQTELHLALIVQMDRHRQPSPPRTITGDGKPLPRIVCLCGSTRFYKAFQEANYRETMAGRIVLSVGFYPHAETEAHGEERGCTPEQKEALDVLHKRKIDLADEVLVLNVGGYIGSSTRSEIEHAMKTGKPIRYLEPVGPVPAEEERK